MRIIVVTNGRLHRDRLFGDLENLADLVLGHLHLDGEFSRIRLFARLLQQLTRDAVHLVDGLDHVHRNTDGAGLVSDRSGDGLTDPPGGIRRELVTTAVFKLVHGLHQADVAFLDEVQELQAAVGVFLCNRDDQAQVGLGHFFFGITGTTLTSGHLTVDLTQVGQRQNHSGLDVDQTLLKFLQCRQVAIKQGLLLGIFDRDLFGEQRQIDFIAPEDFDEPSRIQADFVDRNIANLSLDAADLVDLGAHGVGKLLDHLGREANAHQLVADRTLGLVIGSRTVAIGLECAAHFVEVLFHGREFLESRLLALL